MTEVIHSVATARFRYSAALVPWTDGQLNKLHKLWIRLQKGARRLPPSFPGAVFLFPEERGGLPVPRPKVFLLQALALHAWSNSHYGTTTCWRVRGSSTQPTQVSEVDLHQSGVNQV
jgi:hypothetical protein